MSKYYTRESSPIPQTEEEHISYMKENGIACMEVTMVTRKAEKLYCRLLKSIKNTGFCTSCKDRTMVGTFCRHQQTYTPQAKITRTLWAPVDTPQYVSVVVGFMHPKDSFLMFRGKHGPTPILEEAVTTPNPVPYPGEVSVSLNRIENSVFGTGKGMPRSAVCHGKKVRVVLADSIYLKPLGLSRAMFHSTKVRCFDAAQ